MHELAQNKNFINKVNLVIGSYAYDRNLGASERDLIQSEFAFTFIENIINQPLITGRENFNLIANEQSEILRGLKNKREGRVSALSIRLIKKLLFRSEFALFTYQSPIDSITESISDRKLVIVPKSDISLTPSNIKYVRLPTAIPDYKNNLVPADNTKDAYDKILRGTKYNEKELTVIKPILTILQFEVFKLLCAKRPDWMHLPMQYESGLWYDEIRKLMPIKMSLRQTVATISAIDVGIQIAGLKVTIPQIKSDEGLLMIKPIE